VRVLFVGGTGNTGFRAVRRLIAAGHEVDVMTRREKSDPRVEELAGLGAAISHGDCRLRWTLWEALEGCEVLVSCAHVRYGEACAQACEMTGARGLVQMSSARALSRFHAHSTVREVRAAERGIWRRRCRSVILRPTMIYGGGRDANVERLRAWFCRHRIFPLFGLGLNLVQPVHAEDVASAVASAVERMDQLNRRVYTLGGPEAVTWREFVLAVAQSAGMRRPVMLRLPLDLSIALARFFGKQGAAEMIERHGEDRNVSIQSAEEDLGFSPRSLEEGLAGAREED